MEAAKLRCLTAFIKEGSLAPSSQPERWPEKHLRVEEHFASKQAFRSKEKKRKNKKNQTLNTFWRYWEHEVNIRPERDMDGPLVLHVLQPQVEHHLFTPNQGHPKMMATVLLTFCSK